MPSWPSGGGRFARGRPLHGALRLEVPEPEHREERQVGEEEGSEDGGAEDQLVGPALAAVGLEVQGVVPGAERGAVLQRRTDADPAFGSRPTVPRAAG